MYLFLQENICCGYSLEALGASNEYPQHMFSRRNDKIHIFQLLKMRFIRIYGICARIWQVMKILHGLRLVWIGIVRKIEDRFFLFFFC